ncbi:uncharacterized protein LOC142333772 [Lycorma delicatula]|uniref:uncharacterized protein LOC142333772 n=1 Tax=Lycorma delicatula TaxID=130591 RepID=UPI003F50E6CD
MNGDTPIHVMLTSIDSKQLFICFIITVMFVGILSKSLCIKFRNGIQQTDKRNNGYKDNNLIKSYSNMFCGKFGCKPQRNPFLSVTCSKSMDKYLKLVGESEGDIIMYADMCRQILHSWKVCFDVIDLLQKRCWDMHNATLLLKLIQNVDLLLKFVKNKDIFVYYTEVLMMNNFQPNKCIDEIIKNKQTRDEIFFHFYYYWYIDNPGAKGCDCTKVIEIYNSVRQDRKNEEMLSINCK